MARDLVASGRLQRQSVNVVRRELGPADIVRYGGQTLRFHVDVGYRWVVTPNLYDVVVRFDKVEKVFEVAIEPMD